MTSGDFGTFGLLWILMNLAFFVALIVGAAILTTWLARHSRSKRPQAEVQLPETNGAALRLDILRARYNRGEISREKYQQIISHLKQTPKRH